jgi:hypothetical protein
MAKYKVKEYIKDGRKRYRVRQIPSFAPVGKHKLTDGTEYDFDEDYTVEAASNTRNLEKIGEIRPAHINHWEFNRLDGKPPDSDAVNFCFMDNFTTKKDAKKGLRVHHDLFDLTWKDLNKIPMYGGRSMQILNPETKKFDSLAFLPSIPPAAKGLGRIELDLSDATPPTDDDPDKDLSYIEGHEKLLKNKETVIFAEGENTKFCSVLFKEENMQDEDEIIDDDDVADDDTLDDDTGGGSEFDSSAEPTPPIEDLDEEDEALAAYLADDLEDVLDEKLEAFGDSLIVSLLEKIEMLMLKQPAPGAAPAAPVVQPPTQAVGFSEKIQNAYAVTFSEIQDKIDKRQRVEIGANGEELWDEGQPVLYKIHDIGMQMLSLQNQGRHNDAAAKFQEILAVVDKALPKKVKHIPSHLTAKDKQIRSALMGEMIPEDLKKFPLVNKAWTEFHEGGRYKSTNGIYTRSAANFQEHKAGKKDKLYEFATYYNTQFARHEGIEEIIPLNVIEKINKNKEGK